MAASSSAQTSGLLSANVGRLRRFLVGAGQVVETLCMQNLMAGSGGSGGFQQRSEAQKTISQRYTSLSLPSALGQRVAHDVTFDASGSALLVAFGKPELPLPHESDPNPQARTALASRTPRPPKPACPPSEPT